MIDTDSILLELIYEPGPDGEPGPARAAVVDPRYVQWGPGGRARVQLQSGEWADAPTSGPYPKFVAMPRFEAHGLRKVIAHRLMTYYYFDPDVRVGLEEYIAGRATFEDATARIVRALVVWKYQATAALATARAGDASAPPAGDAGAPPAADLAVPREYVPPRSQGLGEVTVTTKPLGRTIGRDGVIGVRVGFAQDGAPEQPASDPLHKLQEAAARVRAAAEGDGT